MSGTGLENHYGRLRTASKNILVVTAAAVRDVVKCGMGLSVIGNPGRQRYSCHNKLWLTDDWQKPWKGPFSMIGTLGLPGTFIQIQHRSLWFELRRLQVLQARAHTRSRRSVMAGNMPPYEWDHAPYSLAKGLRFFTVAAGKQCLFRVLNSCLSYGTGETGLSISRQTNESRFNQKPRAELAFAPLH